MKRALSRLSTAPDVVVSRVREKVGWFRHRSMERAFPFQDWLVDGVPLRELVAWPNGLVAGEVTPIQNDRAGADLAIASLRALLGEGTGRDWETAMPDGRVALLFCSSCFDLGCGALTAEIVVDDEIVGWRDVGWQVDHAPLDLGEQDSPVISIAFRRGDYERLVRGLIAVEESRRASP